MAKHSEDFRRHRPAHHNLDSTLACAECEGYWPAPPAARTPTTTPRRTTMAELGEMTTIEAPRVAGRSRARDDIASLGLSRGSTLIVEFPPRSAATPSYLDELVGAVCEELGARVVFRGLSERARIVALESAQRRRVSGLVTIDG